MIRCPRCSTHVGSLDEFHVCVEPLHAQFTRQEQQLAYLTERLDALHTKIDALLPPRVAIRMMQAGNSQEADTSRLDHTKR